MPVIGVSLPSNVEAATKRLITEIKALDTQVESFKAKLPANAYTAWKQWAKGTVDALVAVLLKSGVQTAAVMFPLWPAGALFAGGAVTVDKALDDTFIAGEYAKLAMWHETFKQSGVAVVGPAPTAPPGMSVPGGTSPLVEMLTKAAMVTGLGLVAVFGISKVLGR